MDYQQTIDYLYRILPMFSHVGSAAYKKDLHNTKLLCEHLDNPQLKFKTIHVGGTNGKGSVSHMLAGIFQTAGYKTGLYTSPHLYDFRERIRINGEMAAKQFVVDFVDRNKAFIEEIQPSFFEVTVAMAFEYFSKEQVDIAIIEVGLGGRLDSTNIITPGLSIITNIGWDHMNILGNSLDEIASEKAGIIKQNIPVVIGERQNEVEAVFTTVARKCNAPVYFASDNYEAVSLAGENETTSINVIQKERHQVTAFEMDLPGIYQLKNICTVLQACEIIAGKGFIIRREHIKQALKNIRGLTGLHGRWEIIHRHPSIVLEVAHNRNGIEEMLKHIGGLRYKTLHLIIGMVKDKDVDQVLNMLPKDAVYYFTQSGIPRALDAVALQAKGEKYDLKGECYPEVNTALEAAMRSASKDDLVIVCGSIFLVAEVNKSLIIQKA